MTSSNKNAVGCNECAFKLDCGGLEDEASSLWGYFTECVVQSKLTVCDMTCPNNPQLFSDRMRELEGNFRLTSKALKTLVRSLPAYIPKIHNGSGRIQQLSEKIVVVPIHELLTKSGANISCRFTSAEEVRQFFRLSAKTDYIITCISVDADVEMVWEGLKYQGLSESIARLKPVAVITPNFSFFIQDVPRTHTIYNRKRIHMAARYLSDSGCRVILPLSAGNRNDWEIWYRFLIENPKMKYVAKEFQTGLKNPELALQAIQDLSKIQDLLMRPIHPIAFGGEKYSPILKKHFDNFTVIDSRAFMTAVNRRAISYPLGKYSERFSPTAPGESIDLLLDANIKEKRARYD